jgi:DNA polymerase-3 subunit chi
MSVVPEVTFHVNVPNPLDYALRLLRKARSQNARVQVMVDSDWAPTFSDLLWSADQVDFLAHGMLGADQDQQALNRTPIWLDPIEQSQVHWPVIVNMTSRPVPQGDSLTKVHEIVSSDPQALLEARKRWRLYLERGWAPQKHIAKS